MGKEKRKDRERKEERERGKRKLGVRSSLIMNE